MHRPLSVVVLFSLLLPLAPAQEPPEPPATMPTEAQAEADAVRQEVSDFYAEYWLAWKNRDADRVAASMAPDFVGLLYVPGRGVVEFDREKVVTDVHRFFEALGQRDAVWGHQLLGVVPRSSTEAVAAVRNDFTMGAGGGEIEFTLEVLRKQPDGRWVLARKYSEKSPF